MMKTSWKYNKHSLKHVWIPFGSSLHQITKSTYKGYQENIFHKKQMLWVLIWSASLRHSNKYPQHVFISHQHVFMAKQENYHFFKVDDGYDEFRFNTRQSIRVICIKMVYYHFIPYYFGLKFVCLCWGFMAQLAQWGHVQCGQLT